LRLIEYDENTFGVVFAIQNKVPLLDKLVIMTHSKGEIEVKTFDIDHTHIGK
jgi:hypothetical protein